VSLKTPSSVVKSIAKNASMMAVAHIVVIV
jgi:hypothetical protein